jgi:uncharacterized PurR-regulated membrane protein YhhQ (DUF165 family)
LIKVVAALGYLACIVGANWAIERYGFVSVGFGLTAPAGVWFAGLAFSMRDAVQRTSGRYAVVALVIIGAGLSTFISPAFALASGVAFLVSELADMSVYTPLYRRHPFAAVTLSNTVGAVIDSMLFLYIAFGSIAHWQGNVVGKMWTVLPVLFVMWVWRIRAVPERSRQFGAAD